MSSVRALIVYEGDIFSVKTVENWESLGVGSVLVTEDDDIPWIVESTGPAEGGISEYNGKEYEVWYRVRPPGKGDNTDKTDE
jgi:hypothetical protein